MSTQPNQPTQLSHNTPSTVSNAPIGCRLAKASNRFGVDYRLEAARLRRVPVEIIDIHAHIVGAQAPLIYDQVRKLFGVTRTYSMTQIAQVPKVRELLGDSVRFIAFPSFSESDKANAFRGGYLSVIERFHSEFGSRMLKLWASPRLKEVIPEIKELPYGATDLAEVDAPWRVRACELGTALGMMFMIHIADPDIYFKTKYSDTARFGTKPRQYEALERMLDRFTNPWIAAHMGGWPENLGFLDALLTRHPNLHIDTSATKWVVRELGRHDCSELVAFFQKWSGRVLFGSDIVTSDDHLSPQKATQHPMADLADSPEAAFDLYASRYWALRQMFESEHEGESNIADPDLLLENPGLNGALPAPTLRGMNLPDPLLATIYRGAAEHVVERWWREHA